VRVAVPPSRQTPPRQAPSLPLEIEDGVIEEARRRQRRRRMTGIALGAGAAVIALLAPLIGGGGKGGSGPSGARPPGESTKLTLVHGRAFVGGQPTLMGVTPSLQAGNVGVCVRVVDEASCNGPFPSAAYPIYGGGEGFRAEERVGADGEIDAIFTGPSVAAMRVAHVGTFRAEPAPGLPAGVKQIVFYRPPGSRGSVLAPGLSPRILQGFESARHGPALTETLLDASGRPIRIGKSPPSFTLANSYWQGSQAAPARGRCATSSSLPGVRTEWGQVATEIAPDRAVAGPAWLTCLHTWFTVGGASYETALLLNASSPGGPPAMLWGAIPVAGHPGFVEIPPVQQEIDFRIPRLSHKQEARELAERTRMFGRARALREQRRAAQAAGKEHSYWDVFVPPTVARRVGPAWLLVRDGSSLAQRIAFLQALHVTRINLSHSTRTRRPGDSATQRTARALEP
jgi:hypothetical protein